ncbi:hypothetical protein ACFL4T_05715 [candidate division KSB1 bacterium]
MSEENHKGVKNLRLGRRNLSQRRKVTGCFCRGRSVTCPEKIMAKPSVAEKVTNA